METINVDFTENNYDIHIDKGIIQHIAKLLLSKTNNKKVIIVADDFFKDSIVKDIIALLHQFEIHTHFMPAGKANKNMNEVLKIYAILEENDLARDSTLIAIGGGVIGDLAGFIASTWYRGMNLVHIPTTLMAMVDSSVGGKVAINFRQTINAVGNYYHPIFTLMDLDLIDSLPTRDYNSGIAEVIKCAIINDKDFYNTLSTNSLNILNKKEEDVKAFISKSIKIKIAHVQGDIREGNKRLLLNYGHTLGHAIEISTATNYQEHYRHGEGVSLGIMAAAYIAEEHLSLSPTIYASYEKLFQSYSLPTYVSASQIGFSREALLKKCLRNVLKDKKRIDNHLRVVLASEIGKASTYTEVPMKLIELAFHHIIKE
ncbi:MAG: 3-dehydroquinate synthase (EC [uncultured Sulfurovum sp.]|uniref:3-dehydroquinate synthase n=1 Tax=uncultured Sulfurovum sp. TaxID=269237 RepID=A0A6S6TZ68_9BACT|nr:MAG: 3-dehydroquinate synthase (EC [uncultured Sulfurovum sp.]